MNYINKINRHKSQICLTCRYQQRGICEERVLVALTLLDDAMGLERPEILKYFFKFMYTFMAIALMRGNQCDVHF